MRNAARIDGFLFNFTKRIEEVPQCCSHQYPEPRGKIDTEPRGFGN